MIANGIACFVRILIGFCAIFVCCDWPNYSTRLQHRSTNIPFGKFKMYFLKQTVSFLKLNTSKQQM